MPNKPETEEAAQWYRFAALLPRAQGQDFTDCWKIGEQEAGLDLLVAGLLMNGIAISESTRAEIAVVSEVWGVWTALEPGIQRCVGNDRDDAPLRLIRHVETVPLDGNTIGAGAALAGLFVVPWITCDLCGHTLGRVYDREPWGGLSHLARGYVLFFPGQNTATIPFGVQSAWNALNAVRLSCKPVNDT
ncbi:hypothetical protein [Streptomyces sp. NPDC058279]|uniref:hypothetical protein n=1 Tax=Streptomyces sp. NPDC058279 TaxID=3346418 RepID=UPI0036E2C5DB